MTSHNPAPILLAPKPSLTYRLVSSLLVFPVFRGLFRGSTQGNEQVPAQGPLVVVANHGSHLDPPLLGPLIRACGAYPIRRGASDREAIRTATARLQEGWATGVFLDGTRQPDGRVNQPLPGAALLSARSGAPLLPVAIVNSHRALGPGRSLPRLVPIQLRIGELVPPPTGRRRAELDATTAELQRRINAMLDQTRLHP